MKRVEVTDDKRSWVNVTVTGDPELAKEVKGFLALVLDWAVLNEKQALEVRQHLKLYDQTTALKSTDRLSFYIVKRQRKRGEKAGFLFEEAKSKDTKDL